MSVNVCLLYNYTTKCILYEKYRINILLYKNMCIYLQCEKEIMNINRINITIMTIAYIFCAVVAVAMAVKVWNVKNALGK